jgi:phage-related protein
MYTYTSKTGAKTMSREYTIKLIELAEEGVVSWESIAKSALSYMSEADVEDMAITEGFVEEEDEEEESDPIDDWNYVGSRHHY